MSSNSNLVVKQWTEDDKTYYFFNTGAIAYDGAEYIYDEDCNEYCYYCGFCLPPQCLEDLPNYNSNEWVKVLPE